MFGLRKPKKIGIAFGGGGARGFAHIGVIRALLEHGIKFDYAAGCSAGSVAAALYCVGKSYEEIYEAMKNLKKEDFLSSRLFFVPSNPNKIEQTVKKILGEDDSFDACKIPLAILSVDISTGKEFVFTNGPISRAVSASCAVPGLFSPVVHEDMLLMDGGLMNNIPAQVLRDLGCDIVIGIEVNELSERVAKNAGMIEVLSAAIKILVRSNSVKGIMASDLIIKPSTSKHKFNSTEGFEELVEEGYMAAMRMMPQIKQLFNYR